MKLSDQDVQRALAALGGWSIADGKLTKVFGFDSYTAGVVFASAVAHVADSMDHHPDLMIEYKKVTVSTMTHDAGGLTERDLLLAKRIDTLG